MPLTHLVTAPTIKPFGFLNGNGNMANSSDTVQLVVGAFGGCIKKSASSDWECSKWKLGWDISHWLVETFQLKADKLDDALSSITKTLVLHMVTAVFAFFGFFISIFSNKFGFLCATFSGFLAFAVGILSIILDFIIFKRAQQRIVQTQGFEKIVVAFGPAIWIALVGAILLLIGQFFTFFQCCCGRTRSQKAVDDYRKEVSYQPVPVQHHHHGYSGVHA